LKLLNKYQVDSGISIRANKIDLLLVFVHGSHFIFVVDLFLFLLLLSLEVGLIQLFSLVEDFQELRLLLLTQLVYHELELLGI
jgi:hypothetical protein